MIEAGEQKAIAARAFDVAVVAGDIEAVGDGDSIVDFAGECGWRAALVVGQVLGQRVVRVEVESMRHAVRGFELHSLVVCCSGVEGAVEGEPVRVRRARIDVWARGGGLIGRGAGGDLVEILGNVEAVGVHADVADAQRVIVSKLALYGEVPLVRLRIAIVGVDALVEPSATILHAHGGGAVLGNWMSGVPAAVVVLV